MDAIKFAGIRRAVGLGFVCGAVAFLAAVSAGASAEPWRDRLQPEIPGPFPLIRPFQGEFRFGWSDIGAARARATFTHAGDEMRMQVEGGTTGLVRKLWKLEAEHSAIIRKNGLQSVTFNQIEKYSNRTVRTEAFFKPDGLWRQRDVTPDPKGPAKWKRIKVEPIRDIVAAMFFIRSQPLANGDNVGVIAFPGDAAYLVEVQVAGRETIQAAGKSWPAIKLKFQIQKIVKKSKTENTIEPHKKFRNGTVWLSDDENRIPLRAEVDIFIGYVFGELVHVKFTSSGDD